MEHDPDLKKIKKEIDQGIDQAISNYSKDEIKKEINKETDKTLNELIREEVKTKLDEKLNNSTASPVENKNNNQENMLVELEEKSKAQVKTFKSKIIESWNKCQNGLCQLFIIEVLAVGVLTAFAGIGCSSSELFYCVEKSFFGAAPVMFILAAIGLLVAIASFVLSERDPGIALIGALINLPIFVLMIYLIFDYLGLIIFAIALLLWLTQANRRSYY